MTAALPPSSSQSSSNAALAREIVSGLIDTCRDGEHAFTVAARSTADPMLRAELTQYSSQRREFVVELHEAIRSIGDDADDRGPLADDTDLRWNPLHRAAAAGDRPAVLSACERHDVAAIDAYRDALQAQLPYAVGSLVNTQFLAIMRVQHRLQSLADLARGGSPIDRELGST